MALPYNQLIGRRIMVQALSSTDSSLKPIITSLEKKKKYSFSLVSKSQLYLSTLFILINVSYNDLFFWTVNLPEHRKTILS